jgi:hypothetical protein
MEVSAQEVMGAVLLPNLTVEPPWEEPKAEPEIVTVLPIVPEAGLRLSILGITEKLLPLELPHGAAT